MHSGSVQSKTRMDGWYEICPRDRERTSINERDVKREQGKIISSSKRDLSSSSRPLA